ncbi:hypothetical protein AYO44_10480 [Planctomycetaceae bacterium SCGC AG-212-F19]|nr:hypothetical protein AYO44_10480 [Planctomycetaceae bacterium SCGC AG-212-F19]
MDPAALLKALLINAAYQGASAVCAPLQTDDGKPLAIDPLLQDAGLQKKGLLVYEEAKVQYNALLRAFHDHTGIWPDPKVAVPTATAPNIASLVTQGIGALTQLPRETPIGTLGALIDLLTKLSPAAPAKPGQEL